MFASDSPTDAKPLSSPRSTGTADVRYEKRTSMSGSVSVDTCTILSLTSMAPASSPPPKAPAALSAQCVANASSRHTTGS